MRHWVFIAALALALCITSAKSSAEVVVPPGCAIMENALNFVNARAKHFSGEEVVEKLTITGDERLAAQMWELIKGNNDSPDAHVDRKYVIALIAYHKNGGAEIAIGLEGGVICLGLYLQPGIAAKTLERLLGTPV